ncbi:MAG: c-type cytochrome biogenesis protein CcsB [Nocardioides sp.]
MTDTAWGVLSNQAITAAGVVYFLAFLGHLVEWSALRRVPAAVAVASRIPATVTAGGGAAPSDSATAAEPADDTRSAEQRAELFGRLGFLLTLIAIACHGVSLVGRGLAADPNRVPWGNMYEFTVAGSFFVAVIYAATRRRFGLAFLAPVVTGFVLTILMVAVIWLYAPVAPLTEALNSPWLVIHVVSAVIATGAFTVGGMTSLLYLIKEHRPGGSYLARVPELHALDLISYRMHAFGFPVWTFAVLITGPIWAHEAWSRYWNWDPKEVWAFITWVVYAAYLHSRATAGWRGRRAAYVALVGVATLWFNFIGINYFSTTSQHSYAAPLAPASRPSGT